LGATRDILLTREERAFMLEPGAPRRSEAANLSAIVSHLQAG
jgi:hypothetical protein